MTGRCISGKIKYRTQTLAEDALIEAWIQNDYHPGRGPVNVYQCDDCGEFHFTSKGPMNNKLANEMATKSFQLRKQASRWERKFKP
jgi:hypothetical protein